MKKLNPKGFTAIEVMIIIFIFGVIGGAGWYVWQKKQNNDKLNAISTFAACKADKDSRLQESYPEVCVTKNGKSFPNPDQIGTSNLSQAEIEKAAAYTIKFSKLPNDLQVVAIAENAKQAPGCVKNGHLVDTEGKNSDPDVHYAPVGSAIIGVGCDSGSAGLFAKDIKDGSWRFVASTQFAFECKDIFTNPVPKKLFDSSSSECIDKSNKLIPYEQASAQYFM